ncbi:MAG TPA: hypothetical protein VJ891_04540 [Casimicrobiaceae bacterium]|nr:hypothetical protein [Casimicrobiaceae bacterium]
MMDKRNAHEARNRLATGIRAATIVVVLGTLTAVWYPSHHDPAAAAANAFAPSTATALPDMSVYFPDRFPAPRGPTEELPPQF